MSEAPIAIAAGGALRRRAQSFSRDTTRSRVTRTSHRQRRGKERDQDRWPKGCRPEGSPSAPRFPLGQQESAAYLRAGNRHHWAGGAARPVCGASEACPPSVALVSGDTPNGTGNDLINGSRAALTRHTLIPGRGVDLLQPMDIWGEGLYVSPPPWAAMTEEGAQ